MKLDPDEIIIDQVSRRLTPELRLWIAVLIDCIIAIRYGWDAGGWARAWIEDPENDFFEAAAEALGYKPEALRQRIRGMKPRSWYFRRKPEGPTSEGGGGIDTTLFEMKGGNFQ